MAIHPTVYDAAIIGTGRIASRLEKDPLRNNPNTHAGFYSRHPRTQIVAGCDIDAGALSEFGEDWSLPARALFSDYRRMLEEISPDIVSVCAYAKDRVPMALEAMNTGARGLWLEKAIGCSLAEASQLAEEVAARKVAAIVDYPRRSWSPFRKVKQWIAEETLGQLQTVHCLMSSQLIHTGTHAFDILRYWCGEATSVQTSSLEKPCNDNSMTITDCGGRGTIEFSNGPTAFVSADGRGFYIFQFDLMFSKGRIRLGNDVAEVLLPQTSQNYTGYRELFPDAEATRELLSPMPGGISLLDDLLLSVDDPDRPLLYSVENAVEALRIGLAFFQSAQLNGARVSLTDVHPALRVENH